MKIQKIVDTAGGIHGLVSLVHAQWDLSGFLCCLCVIFWFSLIVSLTSAKGYTQLMELLISRETVPCRWGSETKIGKVDLGQIPT